MLPNSDQIKNIFVSRNVRFIYIRGYKTLENLAIYKDLLFNIAEIPGHLSLSIVAHQSFFICISSLSLTSTRPIPCLPSTNLLIPQRNFPLSRLNIHSSWPGCGVLFLAIFADKGFESLRVIGLQCLVNHTGNPLNT